MANEIQCIRPHHCESNCSCERFLHTVYRVNQGLLGMQSINDLDDESLVDEFNSCDLNIECFETSKAIRRQFTSRVITDSWRRNLNFRRQFPNGTIVWSPGRWHRHLHNNWRHQKRGEYNTLFCQECKFTLKLSKRHRENQYRFNRHGTERCQGPIHGVIGIMNVHFPVKAKRDLMTHKSIAEDKAMVIDRAAPGGEPEGFTSSSSHTSAINKMAPSSLQIADCKQTQTARSP